MSFFVSIFARNCRVSRAFSPVILSADHGVDRSFVASHVGRQSRISTHMFSTSSTKQQGSNNGFDGKVKLRNTGGLRKLPVVKSPTELINKAVKAPKRIKNDE